MAGISITQSRISTFLFADTRVAWVWLVIRLYVGWQWLQAGLEKVTNPLWVGDGAGTAMGGFIQGAIAKSVGTHPDVTGWYVWFLQHVIVTHITTWSYVIVYGELLVGIGLILGVFTGVSAFFGMFMNVNYLLAGTVGVNPVLLVLGIGITSAWRVAGYVGVDRFLLPYVSRLHKAPHISV